MNNKTLVAVALSTFLTMPLDVAASNEGVCLGLASYAGKVAVGKALGITHQEITKIASDAQQSPHKARIVRTTKMVIDWVYIINPSEEDAKKLTYLKCLAGDYQ